MSSMLHDLEGKSMAAICVILLAIAIAQGIRSENASREAAEASRKAAAEIENSREHIRLIQQNVERKLEEMDRYDSSDDIARLDARIDRIERYTEETRRYVEWER